MLFLRLYHLLKQTHINPGVLASLLTNKSEIETWIKTLASNYNLGQNKMEQQAPIPPKSSPKSRMKPCEG